MATSSGNDFQPLLRRCNVTLCAVHSVYAAATTATLSPPIRPQPLAPHDDTTPYFAVVWDGPSRRAMLRLGIKKYKVWTAAAPTAFCRDK